MAFGEGAQADGVAAATARSAGAPGPLGSVVEEGIGLIADVDQAAAGAELVDGLQDSLGTMAPLGLFGETVTIARVRVLMACSSRSGSGITPASTATGLPPAMRTAISWLK